MLDELKPMSLTRAAQQLGTDPFEVVRLRVLAGDPLTSLSMRTEQVEKLRQVTGKR